MISESPSPHTLTISPAFGAPPPPLPSAPTFTPPSASSSPCSSSSLKLKPSSPTNANSATRAAAVILRPFAYSLSNASPVPWCDLSCSSAPRQTPQDFPAGKHYDPSPTQRHRPSTSLRESSSSKTPRLSVQSVGTQIRQRYYESLYLGEFHSPLSSFLDQLSRLTATGHDSRNYQALAGILRPLLTSQANLSSKYRHAIPDLLHQTCGGKVPGGPGMLDEYEAAMIRRALNSGPGTSVRDQVVDNIKSDQGSKHTAKVINAWIKAMENREMQLQMLLLLFLLRLSAEMPHVHLPAHNDCSEIKKTDLGSTSAPSRCEAGKNKDQSAEVSASVQEKRSPAEEGPKKRKRKPELPKRWSGSDSFFPWDRRSRNQTSEDPLELLNEVHHLEKENDIGPESLNKRLESLSDRACLSIVTGSLSDELTQELDFLCDESSHPAKEGYARSEAKVSLPSFGSSSRPGKSESDERDEMQWLLSDVIEPFFSQSLPRQCSALRSKCYVPGSGATPSRPTLGPSTSKQPERDELAKTETDLAAKGAASRARARDRAQNRPRLKDALQLEEENKSVRGLSASNRKDLAKNREVSMNRKFSRSISACYGMRQGSQPPVEPLPTAEERGEESQSMGTVERKAFATGRLGKRKGEAQRRVDGLSSRFSSLPSKHQETESDGKGHGKPPTTLVLSTPQKSVRNSTLSGYRKASVPVFPPLGPSHDSFSIALEKFDGRSNTLSKDGTQELQVTSHKPSSTTTSSTLFKSSAFRRAESQPSIPLRLDQNQNLLASSTSGKHGGSPPMRQPGSADRDDVKKDEMDGESDVDLGLQDEEEEDNHKHGETYGQTVTPQRLELEDCSDDVDMGYPSEPDDDGGHPAGSRCASDSISNTPPQNQSSSLIPGRRTILPSSRSASDTANVIVLSSSDRSSLAKSVDHGALAGGKRPNPFLSSSSSFAATKRMDSPLSSPTPSTSTMRSAFPATNQSATRLNSSQRLMVKRAFSRNGSTSQLGSPAPDSAATVDIERERDMQENPSPWQEGEEDEEEEEIISLKKNTNLTHLGGCFGAPNAKLGNNEAAHEGERSGSRLVGRTVSGRNPFAASRST